MATRKQIAADRRNGKKVGKKRVSRKHRGTKVVPEHMLGKSLKKHVGKKRVSRKRGRR